jgi:hypothetical protein
MLVGQSDKQNNRSPRYLPWRKKSVQEDPPLPLSPTNNGSPDNFWVLIPTPSSALIILAVLFQWCLSHRGSNANCLRFRY